MTDRRFNRYYELPTVEVPAYQPSEREKVLWYEFWIAFIAIVVVGVNVVAARGDQTLLSAAACADQEVGKLGDEGVTQEAWTEALNRCERGHGHEH